jgi:tRNA pseudouridine55 synthase
MARRRKQGRDVNGILLLDKPYGISSNHALQRVKRLYAAAKAGHTGSLDPLATGLLPLCLGYTTKFSAFLLDADKRYRVTVRLGVTTSTADAEGEVTATAPTDGVTEAALREVIGRFIGSIEQLPPMYSAVKHQGQRLYKLAREGKEVERTPRTIQIYALDLMRFELPEIELDVHCSKGTYVRTLAEEIGAGLGCGGHVSALRRIGVGPYVEGSIRFVTMDDVEAAAEQGMRPWTHCCCRSIPRSTTVRRCDYPPTRPSIWVRGSRCWCRSRPPRARCGSMISPSDSSASASSSTTDGCSPSDCCNASVNRVQSRRCRAGLIVMPLMLIPLIRNRCSVSKHPCAGCDQSGAGDLVIWATPVARHPRRAGGASVIARQLFRFPVPAALKSLSERPDPRPRLPTDQRPLQPPIKRCLSSVGTIHPACRSGTRKPFGVNQ